MIEQLLIVVLYFIQFVPGLGELFILHLQFDLVDLQFVDELLKVGNVRSISSAVFEYRFRLSAEFFKGFVAPVV